MGAGDNQEAITAAVGAIVVGEAGEEDGEAGVAEVAGEHE